MTAVTATQVASSVPFDNATNGFTSDMTQPAIEEIDFRQVIKSPTGFLNKYADSVVTFTDLTRTFTIAPNTPTYTYFTYYFKGIPYQITTTLSKTITDTEGLWFFYFDATGLQASQTPWSLTAPVVPIANAYWDSTNKKFITKNEERHGLIMDFDTHFLLHRAEGPKIDTVTYPPLFQLQNYTTTGDGSLNSHAQFGIGSGTFFDEDLTINVTNSAAPANNFEQILNPILYAPVFYLSGTDSWRKKAANSYPFVDNGPNCAYYNYYNGSTWALQPCTDGYFFATWLMITDDMSNPVVMILGQRQDTNIISSINNNTRADLSLPRKFTEEFYFFKKIIWQTSTSYGNTPKTRLVYMATTTEIQPSNDRWAIICSYNGNAGSNKYLEFYPGQSSAATPFPCPTDCYVKTITLSAIANSTGTVNFYKSTDLNTILFSLSLNNSIYARLDFAYLLNNNDKIVAKVAPGGSINKPAITLFLQTTL